MEYSTLALLEVSGTKGRVFESLQVCQIGSNNEKVIDSCDSFNFGVVMFSRK